jgi:outer membrane protein TolC
MIEKAALQKIKVGLATLLIAFSPKANGQTTLSITLDEAIQRALKNSKELQIAKIEEKIADEQHKQTLSIYLPQVSASYFALATDNPLNAFGFKLQQQSITANDFNPLLLNHPSDSYNMVAILEVKQPLLNIDMIYQRKAADKQSLLYKYKAQRTQEYITFEVQKAFMQLQFAYQAEKVIKEALATAQSVYDFTKNRYNQGLLQKSDLLNAQVQVTILETKVAEATSAIQNASDFLALFIGRTSNLTYTPIGEWEKVQNDDSRLLSDTRADFMALSNAIEASQMNVKSSQASFLPRINAFASYQYNNSNLKEFGSGAYLAGVQLSWSIFNGLQTRHQINERRFTTSKLQVQLAQQKEQATFEVTKTQRGVDDSKVKIAQQKKVVEQSEESLRILRNRYEKGLVNTTDMLQGQSQLALQQLNLEQAILEHNIMQAYLHFLTVSSSN